MALALTSLVIILTYTAGRDPTETVGERIRESPPLVDPLHVHDVDLHE